MAKLLQKYLRFWAKIYLNRAKPEIIVITGSVGKTSTKEAIFEVLRVKYGHNIRKSHGNLNNETGVPLAILGYKKSPKKFWQWFPVAIAVPFEAIFGKKTKILVLEMAADKPGDIAYLTDFIKPKVAVITSIGPAHLAAFHTMEKIVEEKTSLLSALSDDGWAVLNTDDENLKKYILYKYGPWQLLTYGLKEKANISAENITTEINGFKPQTKFQVSIGESKFDAQTQTLGRTWNIYSALAAVACGQIFKMNSSQINEGLGNIQELRMKILKGKENTTIIDDSYNANPLSMRAALDVLHLLPKPQNEGRKIAVLGDMLEIGNISDEAHRLIGEYAHEVADVVISVGEQAKKYAGTKHFDNAREAAEYLLGEIQTDDIILIKASRAIGLEKVAEALKE